jgi:hypothetical protein
METQIQESSQQSIDLQARQATLAENLEIKVAKKQSLINETLIYQKLQRRYQDLRDKKYKFISTDDGGRKLELEKARERFTNIGSLIQNIKLEIPPRLKPCVDYLDKFLETTLQTVENV